MITQLRYTLFHLPIYKYISFESKILDCVTRSVFTRIECSKLLIAHVPCELPTHC